MSKREHLARSDVLDGAATRPSMTRSPSGWLDIFGSGRSTASSEDHSIRRELQGLELMEGQVKRSLEAMKLRRVSAVSRLQVRRGVLADSRSGDEVETTTIRSDIARQGVQPDRARLCLLLHRTGFDGMSSSSGNPPPALLKNCYPTVLDIGLLPAIGYEPYLATRWTRRQTTRLYPPAGRQGQHERRLDLLPHRASPLATPDRRSGRQDVVQSHFLAVDRVIDPGLPGSGVEERGEDLEIDEQERRSWILVIGIEPVDGESRPVSHHDSHRELICSACAGNVVDVRHLAAHPDEVVHPPFDLGSGLVCIAAQLDAIDPATFIYIPYPPLGLEHHQHRGHHQQRSLPLGDLARFQGLWQAVRRHVRPGRIKHRSMAIRGEQVEWAGRIWDRVPSLSRIDSVRAGLRQVVKRIG